MDKTATKSFNIKEIVSDRISERAELYRSYVNPKFTKAMETIGFDRDFVRGEGNYLWDRNDNKYLDFITGYGMFNMGRNHPVIKKAIRDYLEMNDTWKISMSSTLLPGLLAEKLLEFVPHLDKVYFGNSGTECVETALKFARKTTGREAIVYCNRAFHGLSYGSLSVNGSDKFRDGFESFLPGPVKVPLNDISALEQIFRTHSPAGVIVEPVQGKGVYPADPEYLLTVQKLCREHDSIFILDEVQTGMGRTGKLFAYQHVPDLEPDMVLVSKSLSGGMVPVGAVLMTEHIYKSVYSSLDKCVVHSSTFGGGGLPMVCGLAALHVIEKEQLTENAAEQGKYMISKMEEMIPEYELLKEIRGQGLMIGIEFGKPKSMTLKTAWSMIHAADRDLFPQAVIMPLMDEHHILTQVAGHHIDVIKLLPTLTITREDADWFLEAFKDTMDKVHRPGGPLWSTFRHLARFATGV